MEFSGRRAGEEAPNALCGAPKCARKRVILQTTGERLSMDTSIAEFKRLYGSVPRDSFIMIGGESWPGPSHCQAEPSDCEIAGDVEISARCRDAMSVYRALFGTWGNWEGFLPADFIFVSEPSVRLRVAVHDFGVCATATVHLRESSLTIAVIPRHRAAAATGVVIRRELGHLDPIFTDDLSRRVRRTKRAECVRSIASVHAPPHFLVNSPGYQHLCLTLIRAMLRWLTDRDAAALFRRRAAQPEQRRATTP
jgi:hypothetical protein